MNLLEILPLSAIPAIDKIISLGILLTFAYFFWNKITSVENKRDADNAANQKKYEDLVNSFFLEMEKRFADVIKENNRALDDNSNAIAANTTIIKTLIHK